MLKDALKRYNPIDWMLKINNQGDSYARVSGLNSQTGAANGVQKFHERSVNDFWRCREHKTQIF